MTRPAASSWLGAGALQRTRPVAKAPSLERHVRRAWSLPLFAFMASFSFIMVSVIDPTSGAAADVETYAPAPVGEAQEFVIADGVELTVETADYDITDAPPPPPPAAAASFAPPAGTPDPGSAKAIAADMVSARGWGADQYNCLVALWQKESGWNVYAMNPSSGAYGIPQSLPGNKMASVGADWQTNAATQITWGLNYIQGRYGAPCGAWAHSQQVGWY